MSSESTLKWAKEAEQNETISVERGQLIPRKWEEEYMDNSGRTEEHYQGEIAGPKDVVLDYNGL